MIYKTISQKKFYFVFFVILFFSPRGFRQMGDRCVDVDECVEQQGLCPRPGTCKNTHGSFKCVCPRGYRLDDSGTFCIDRNECEEDGDKCDGSDCRNSLGSYK